MVALYLLNISLLVNIAGSDLSHVRALYQQAPVDAAKASSLIQLLNGRNTYSSTMEGYRGAATMVMAKHVSNPYLKLRYFKEGKGILEGAIARDENNTELRYLRCTIQTQLPAFLGYNQQIAQDRAFLKKQLSSLTDVQLRTMIQSLLKEDQE